MPARLQNKATILPGPLPAALDRLAAAGYRHLYVDGGAVIRGCLDMDRVDTLIITRVPILLGAGVPLFGPLSRRLRFRLDRTEALTDDLVKSTDTRIRTPS